MLPKASLGSIVKEEISLEGLEGSTLETLWNHIALRLQMAMPLPQKLMDSIWTTVVRNAEFEFYLLLAVRRPYVSFDRLANVDPDTGVPVHPSEYPGHRFKYKPVEANGVRGSCEEYDTRTRIPREELMSISWREAEERYGLKFVIVASQRMRESFLIDRNCTTELTVMQYCMLEWIGRSRFNGETSHGKFSLLEVCGDSSALFYHRKALSNAKLITRQNLAIRSDDVSIQGMVLHLPRYYNEMKSKTLLIAERVVSELKRRKYFFADYEEIKVMMLGRSDAGRLFRTPEFQRYIKTDEMVPYRELYPDAPVSVWQTRRGEERHVRIMRLIDSTADINDREGPEEADAKDCFLARADSSVLHVDMPLLRLAFNEVAKSGDTGISQTELATALGLDRLNARSVVKNLVKLKAIESHSVDEGRQRLAKFVLPGRSQHATVFDKELTQFVSNQLEVIENQRQQQCNMGAAELFHSSQSMPVTRSSTDSPQAMFNSSTHTTGSNITTDVPSLDPLDNTTQEPIVVNVTLSDKIQQRKASAGISNAMNSKTVSELMLRRCNFIIELVKQEQVVEPRTILKKLNAGERLTGHKHEACSKSILRMIGRLAADRLVVIANVTMKRDETETKLVYVCDPKVTLDQPALHAKLSMAKARIVLQSQPTTSKQATLSNCTEVRGYSGCLSKCLRMKLLHEYLFYLVYEHKRDARDLAINELSTIDLTGLEAHELSPIYSDTNDWKMFVPPLDLKHESRGSGWILLTDAFVRMPLGIFCSICAFAFYTSELDYYLDHPIRRYLLIKHLPSTIRSQLLSKRRYIYAILDTIKLLCYAGLLQMGPKLAKVRDETFVYVNRSTALLDTTASRAGYNEIEDREYPLLSFQFTTLAHVKEYWKKLYEVAIGTCINTRSTAVGKEVLVQPIQTKPAMMDAMREQSPETARANDCAQLPPGDRKGAAGMDTAMFIHLKSNWHKLINVAPPVDRQRLKRLRKAIVTRKSHVSAAGARGLEGKRLSLKHPIGASGAVGTKIGPTVSKKIKRGKHVAKRRFVHPRKPLPRRAWQDGYDEIDQHALKLMSKLRVSWTRAEDHLLLLSRVAILYLYGTTMSVFCPVNSTTVRDIIHWASPRSLSKTSRACQRRSNYMVTKLHGYADQVRAMLEESKLNATIGARFGPDFVRKLRERFRTSEDYIVAARIHFVQLVHLFRRTFTRQLQGEGRGLLSVGGGYETDATRRCTLPNTVSEFYRQYNVIETSVDSARLNYSSDPATAEELARYILTIVIHSAIVNRRIVCEEQLQNILDRYVESNVTGAMRLLRNFQVVAVKWTKGRASKVIVSSAGIVGEKRSFHMSISYQQQLMTSIPFELFVPMFEQMATLLGRERCTEDRYECDDGGEGMLMLLSELVAVGRVELSINQPANYIEMRPDAVKGNSEVLSQLRKQGFAEVTGESAEAISRQSSKGTTVAQPLYAEVFSELRGHGFLEPAAVDGKSHSRKSSATPKRTPTKSLATAAAARSTSCTKGSKTIRFSHTKDVTFHYLMHPIERLSKLPIEYFHFFCIMEQLRVADRRLLAQTFKIDELQPTTCSLPNCTITTGPTGVDLLGRCLALVRGRREQLDRITQQGVLQKGTARQNRIDATQFFDVREDNLLLFFGKYIEEFRHRAGLKHKRDINRQQEMLGLSKTAVNMAELIGECLVFDEESPEYNWLDRYEVIDTAIVVDEDEPGEGEDDRQTTDMLRALSEKVFKLHNFYEVTSMKIHVQVRTSPKYEDQEREAYGQWSIPRAFLSEGAKRRNEILLKVASDAVWPQPDQLAPLMNEVMTLIERNLHACALLDFIAQKHKLGANVGELAAAFPNHSQLEQHLRTLQGFKLLLRTGFRSVTYVHWRYADEWLIKSLLPAPEPQQVREDGVGQDASVADEQAGEPVAGPSSRKRKAVNAWEQEQMAKKVKMAMKSLSILAPSEQEHDRTEATEKLPKYIHIAMAPWIQIDGTLNKRLLYRWLSSILLYCVGHPGVPFSVLFTRFNMMSPFHLRQLLDILQEYGCVSLHSMHCHNTKTLFSLFKPAKIVVGTEFVSDEQTYIETPPNALSMLSLCIGEYRKYTQELYDPVRRSQRGIAKTNSETAEV